MRIRSIENEIEETKNLLLNNGIKTEDEFEELYKTAEQEVLSIEPSKTGDALIRHTCRRLKQKMIKCMQQNIQNINCFIFARLPDNDFNRKAIKNAQQFIFEHGEEAAIEKGYINQAGDYIFTGGFNKGEKIDPNQVWGTAVGICQNENGETEGRVISINSRFIDDAIPLGVELTLDYTEGKKAHKTLCSDNKQYYYKGSTIVDDAFLSIDAMNACEKAIKDIIGDNIFESYNALEEAAENKIDDKFNILGVVAACLEIGVSTDGGNIPITFEMGDPMEDANCKTLWVSPKMLESLNIQDGAYGLLMLNAFEYKDEVRYNVAGFLPLDEE